jgi:hypothetical protein
VRIAFDGETVVFEFRDDGAGHPEVVNLQPRRGDPMTPDPVEILLVEDNPNDVELTLYALKKLNIANHIEVMRDGAEALDIVGRGFFPGQGIP